MKGRYFTMKRHEFIQSVVRAEMSDKEQIRQNCISGTEKVSQIGYGVWVKRLIPAAACFMVILAAVIAFPYLNSDNERLIEKPGTVESQPQDGTKQAHTSDAQGKIYPLALNKIDMQSESERVNIPGHFWQELSDKQKTAVYPDFGFKITATVNYSSENGKASVFDVKARDESENGGGTTITFAPGQIAECEIWDAGTETSYVHGIPVTAGVYYSMFTAEFKLEDIAFKVSLNDDNSDRGLERLTAIVNAIITNGAPDMSVFNNPVIPTLRDDIITLQQAYSDPDFGAYMPKKIPDGYGLEGAARIINQETNGLFVTWSRGLSVNVWHIFKATDYELERIVSANEHEKYDMSRYPVPHYKSIPDELWDVVTEPMFRAEELTLDIIRARAYKSGRSGAEWHINFNVLYGDTVVRLNANGITPEQAWEMFAGLK